MNKIRFSEEFQRHLAELIENNPELEEKVEWTIQIFVKKSSDTRLKTHSLKRHLQGYYALSVDSDIRIIFEWQGKQVAIFLNIGSHKQVYGKRKRRQGNF